MYLHKLRKLYFFFYQRGITAYSYIYLHDQQSCSPWHKYHNLSPGRGLRSHCGLCTSFPVYRSWRRHTQCLVRSAATGHRSWYTGPPTGCWFCTVCWAWTGSHCVCSHTHLDRQHIKITHVLSYNTFQV